MTVSDLEEDPRFFGARRGALPIEKQRIAQGDTALMPVYEALLMAAD